MESLKPQVIKGISEIAEAKLDMLADLWKKLFEPDIGQQHMKKVLEHVDAFFTDIIVETQNRETAIRERIDSLNREKLDLKRLLKEDVDDVLTSIPLHTLQMNIDDSLKDLREKLQTRHKEITALLKEQDVICNELDEPKRPLVSDPLPSEAEMQEFREYLEGLKDEKYNRHGKILELREEIKQLMDVMEITDLNKYDKQLVNNTEMSPTRLNIQKLVEVHEAFVSQYDKMKFQIEDMHKRLAKLWRYLDIPESHHRQFSKYTDITQTSYNKLLQEVQRCEQIKRENIRNFIEKVRLEIEEYWEKCLKSEAERLRFPSYTENVFNEDVLELHEDELRELKMFYENNEAIFNIIQERQELWSQMELMQNKESDPKRYNNRGGQLLKEERERKMITMKLPKIEARLLELVEKFENENNRPFTMYGAKIEDVIEREYEVKRQEKLTKSGKKILDTPARTPCRVNMTGLRTPLTIEQTIINHTTAMKSTGARLRIATQPRTQSKRAINDTASSTASSVRSVKTNTGKRRLPQQKAPEQNAKRQLLGAFASPSNGNVLRPRNENIVGVKKPASSKNTSMKVYNVGSVIKRRSRKSNGKKPRTSLHKSQRSIRPVPDIVLDQAESTITERDTTSYEGFENYVQQSKSVVRSSEIARPQFLAVNHYGFASPVVKKLSTPGRKRIGTPSASTPTARGVQPKELEFSMII